MRFFSGLAVAIAMVVCGAAIAQDTPRESDRPQRAEGERRGGNRDREARPGDRPGGAQGSQERRRGGQSGQGKGGQRGGGGGQRQGGGGGIFRLLDVDRDGKLSPQEINHAVAVLSKLDANKDGMLDAEELAVRGGGGAGKGGQRPGGQGAKRPKK